MGWAWLWWLAVAALLLALLAGFVLVRARALDRLVGSFSCAVREVGSQRWTSGVAAYGVGRIDWYRLVSISPRPRHRWSRTALDVDPQRLALPGGPAGVVEVRCRAAGKDFHLALTGAALDGLTSWLESRPPMDPGL